MNPVVLDESVPMLLLNGGALPTLRRCREKYGDLGAYLGRLARPRNLGQIRESLSEGFQVAFDNDAFSDWNQPRYARQVARIEEALYGRVLKPYERVAPLATLAPEGWAALGIPQPPPLPAWHPNFLWMTVPDVPFDSRATLQRFDDWCANITHLPLAFCVQDGAEKAGIPWAHPNLRCLFMAGSTAFKLSSEMADLCREGQRRGLWIHGGRVNTRTRIRYMLALGVDSIDGTGFDRFRDAHLGWGLAEVSATSYQLLLT